ncbi:MAG: ribosome biogenesis GTPase YqeH [Erysipelotrichia bacterium]|jgi:ribosome biogenesis GTPase A|nr:ribosome biogenesis GTPase YqeH [Erysipelotrichia bacterium]
MAKLNIIRRCYSCGVVLQSKDHDKDGYVEKELLQDLSKGVLFCQKCFHSEKYNLSPREASLDHEFFTLIADAQATDALIVYVINLFSFEAGFIRALNHWLSGLDILVIANKRDIIPQDVSDEALKEYVAHRLRVEKLKVLDVKLVSASENYNIRDVIDAIKELRRRRDVYIIGQKHSGKTTLMETFLKEYKNVSRTNIITQNYPGTNLKVMQIPIDQSTYFYDTPGLGNDNSILEKVEKQVLKSVVPIKRVEKRLYTLNKDQSLFIGGLARIELVEGEKTAVGCYFSSEVDIRKIIVPEPNNQFLRTLNKNLLHPTSKNLQSLKDFDIYDVVVDEEGSRDIGINGLGWFSFIANKQTFRLYVPKGVSFYTTRSKIEHVK